MTQAQQAPAPAPTPQNEQLESTPPADGGGGGGERGAGGDQGGGGQLGKLGDRRRAEDQLGAVDRPGDRVVHTVDRSALQRALARGRVRIEAADLGIELPLRCQPDRAADQPDAEYRDFHLVPDTA